MQARSGVVVAPIPVARSSPAIRLPGLFIALAGVYLVAAAFLTLGFGPMGDAWSRVGNAYYVLFSRDPHLAAIGFVWNPLPSLLAMPLLPLAGVWPPLVTYGFAANIVSALAMAGAATQLRALLGDLGLSPLVRGVLLASFALHPMVAYYATNGMSEALFLLFLIAATRAMTRWLVDPATTHLAGAGGALALAYLVRYEAIAAFLAATVAVAGMTYLRTDGPRAERARHALADALVLGMPPAAAITIWAGMSWIITGNPFETFTSVYGNSSQVGLNLEGIRQATGDDLPSAIAYLGRQMLGLEPLLPVLVLGALAVLVVRRDRRTVAPLALFGAVLAFAAWAFLSGRSFGWLRFSIVSIPLAVVVVGLILAPQPLRGAPGWARRGRSAARAGLATLLMGGLVVAVPTAGRTMLDPALAREEATYLGPVTGASSTVAHQYDAPRAAARHVDGLMLPDGAVLVDVAIGFPIVLSSRSPRQFVITPDRDFHAVLADPAAFGVRYVLVPSNSPLDAISRAYPDAYARGEAYFGPLVAEFGASGWSPSWRLYQVGRG